MKSKEEILAHRRSLGLPHWAPAQRRRLRQCMSEGMTIAYWNSDAHGQPCNGGDGQAVYAGLVQRLGDRTLEICGPNALHATLEPHKWKGVRVWVVALNGEIQRGEDKLGALYREILGEILPEEAMDPIVGVRLGRKDLQSADLQSADLQWSNLRLADLQSADLTGAYRESNPPDGWKIVGGRLQKV